MREPRRRQRWSVVAAQAVGQLALVAVMPLLTRVVPAVELGYYQAGLAAALVLQPVATLRTELVLPSLVSQQEFRRVRRVGTLGVAGSVLILAVATAAASGTGAAAASSAALMAGVLVLSYGWTALDNAVLIRDGSLGRLSVRNLLGGVVAAGLQAAAALVWPSAPALAAALLLGRGAAVLVTRRWRRAPAASADGPPDEREWSFRRGVVAVLSGVAASGAAQSLVLFGGWALGPTSAADLGVAQRSAGAPLGLVSQGLSQATQAVIAPLVRARDSRTADAVLRQVRGLVPVALAVVVAMAVLAPLLAEVVFGAGWARVGTIVAVLAVPSGLQLLIAPVLPVFLMVGAEKSMLVLQIVRLVASVVAAAALHLATGQLIAAVAGYSAVTTAWYVVTFAFLMRRLRAFGR